MSELLQAAKVIIGWLDQGIVDPEDKETLRAAVERAEKQEAFNDAVAAGDGVLLNEAYEHGYIAGQKAMKAHERERIRARVRLAAISSWSASEVYIGPPLIQLQKFVDRLLEDGDE